MDFELVFEDKNGDRLTNTVIHITVNDINSWDSMTDEYGTLGIVLPLDGITKYYQIEYRYNASGIEYVSDKMVIDVSELDIPILTEFMFEPEAIHGFVFVRDTGEMLSTYTTSMLIDGELFATKLITDGTLHFDFSEEDVVGKDVEIIVEGYGFYNKSKVVI